jgi:hypothetical protein
MKVSEAILRSNEWSAGISGAPLSSLMPISDRVCFPGPPAYDGAFLRWTTAGPSRRLASPLAPHRYE